MRQRAIKDRANILEENKAYIVQDPINCKGKWHSLFSDVFEVPEASAEPKSEAALSENAACKRDLYIEIGSGKGQFIAEKARLNPDRLYLACEGGLNIAPRILQKAAGLKLKNLLVITDYIIDPADYFEPGELAGVYINFCDPWPKDRYAHRRLTYYKKLLSYKEIMRPGSTLEFKTDNDVLFDFSLEQLELAELKADYITRDLHSSELADSNIETEYEHKFSEAGKTINYLRIVF